MVVEHAARQVALVEGRVGAAREYREVDHVGEAAQHLFVDRGQVDCRESGYRGWGEYLVCCGENVYKIVPDRS